MRDDKYVYVRIRDVCAEVGEGCPKEF